MLSALTLVRLRSLVPSRANCGALAVAAALCLGCAGCSPERDEAVGLELAPMTASGALGQDNGSLGGTLPGQEVLRHRSHGRMVVHTFTVQHHPSHHAL